jgi:DNA (cytosine-5)-methyltransferase 1
MTNYTIPTVAKLRANTEHGNHKFEVVSLFAGGGGSSTGYRMAGGKVLAVNEFIPEAINTYQANWPTTKILAGDVRKLTAEQILDAIERQVGELDILDGSPPCSAFSTAGSREKGWGKTKKYSDAEQSNVEDLFFEYIRILRGIQPKVFIAENVSGLAKGTAKGYLNEIMRELRASGYQVSCRILNAKWLGIPQSRPRTIFVGVRNDIWKQSYKDNMHPAPQSSIVTLQDAFDGIGFSDSDRIETDLSRYAIYNLLKQTPEGSAHPIRFGLKKCPRNGVAFCITATTGSTGAANPYHWDNRAFTVSEVKRIMSIPDDYVLTGNYQKQVERLGRMVAPFMMKAVAENLLSLGIFDENTN